MFVIDIVYFDDIVVKSEEPVFVDVDILLDLAGWQLEYVLVAKRSCLQVPVYLAVLFLCFQFPEMLVLQVRHFVLVQGYAAAHYLL